ncbi:MAG: UDP-N-acetylglucosamine 1-carboxyvinyltransferase [Lachnospiraceae bacterium]
MSAIRLCGLHSLNGEITIQGSKNAVLPVMAASLLHKGTTVISNVPEIQDVFCMKGILEYLGCRISFKDHTMVIDTRDLTSIRIPDMQVKQMRSSIMLLGPLLGRLGEAATCHPGGCSIGKRPVDLHIFALRKLGAEIRVEGERIIASAQRLQSADIRLDYPSVGATENALMAAVAAEGTTRIYGAAQEPEIMELCRFLTQMGAEISGAGTDTLIICGRQPLHDVTFRVAGDRIVAGTYLGALLAAGGSVFLREAPVHHLEQMVRQARKMGAVIAEQPDGLLAVMEQRPRTAHIQTAPHPGFPTDLQSVMLAVAAVADGVSVIEETVFEGRFATADELQKMGALIEVTDKTATVTGVRRLHGAEVAATDLRGGAALVVAGLVAEGETVITGYEHIRRGYEDICRDLAGVGAVITKG